MKDKISMPLIEAMLQYKSEDVYPLHTPGHKGGRGMQRLLRQELGASVQMDVSLMSELDDIHEPETYIKEAQERALGSQRHESGNSCHAADSAEPGGKAAVAA